MRSHFKDILTNPAACLNQDTKTGYNCLFCHAVLLNFAACFFLTMNPMNPTISFSYPFAYFFDIYFRSN